MQLVFMGMTGSGKSRLARDAADAIDIPLISSGELARNIAEDSPHEKLQLQAGFLAPETAMRREVSKAVEGALAQKGSFILDGFPRSFAQYVYLINLVRPHMPTFFLIDPGDTIRVVDRLIERGRSDDNPDAIEQKIKDWETNVLPLVDKLAQAGTLTEIDNSGAYDIALEELLSWIK